MKGIQEKHRGLPYGSEEAYTADGVKYYIKAITLDDNDGSAVSLFQMGLTEREEAVDKDSPRHVTQTTSWSPPGLSSGAPELTPPPPPQETLEVEEERDGEAAEQRQNPTTETKM
ncbi:uncharacterized protein LOC112847700 isoform X1 [Oreochromis niloticus]|uniref:uncharacterized protein LOC112847700 isoform X1 n=1 Tax=Oreochromis niloticus TaxID=8128 RepID=UPI000DF1DAB4|nr:uncharacterized protein LOC112847700 isoform X1 [Oreochromis niloticus]